MNKITCFLTLLILFMSSCIKMEDVSVRGVNDVSIRGFSGVDMSLDVENNSRRNINIETARFRVDNGGKQLVTIMLRDGAMIRKRTAGSVDMSWVIKFDNPLGALSMISSLKRSLAQMTVTGEIVVKSGWMKKKIELDNVPMSQILSTFGLKSDDIIKSLGI